MKTKPRISTGGIFDRIDRISRVGALAPDSAITKIAQQVAGGQALSRSQVVAAARADQLLKAARPARDATRLFGFKTDLDNALGGQNDDDVPIGRPHRFHRRRMAAWQVPSAMPLGQKSR